MTDDSRPLRTTYDVSTIASNLQQLHEYVTQSNQRIEITRPGSDDRCILISQTELSGLERALEILSNTDDVREISGKIAMLAAVTGPGELASA